MVRAKNSLSTEQNTDLSNIFPVEYLPNGSRFVLGKVVLEYVLASRMQQLKMATYFEEILGDMLLKVNFL